MRFICDVSYESGLCKVKDTNSSEVVESTIEDAIKRYKNGEQIYGVCCANGIWGVDKLRLPDLPIIDSKQELVKCMLAGKIKLTKQGVDGVDCLEIVEEYNFIISCSEVIPDMSTIAYKNGSFFLLDLYRCLTVFKCEDYSGSNEGNILVTNLPLDIDELYRNWKVCGGSKVKYSLVSPLNFVYEQLDLLRNQDIAVKSFTNIAFHGMFYIYSFDFVSDFVDYIKVSPVYNCLMQQLKVFHKEYSIPNNRKFCELYDIYNIVKVIKDGYSASNMSSLIISSVFDRLFGVEFKWKLNVIEASLITEFCACFSELSDLCRSQIDSVVRDGNLYSLLDYKPEEILYLCSKDEDLCKDLLCNFHVDINSLKTLHLLYEDECESCVEAFEGLSIDGITNSDFNDSEQSIFNILYRYVFTCIDSKVEESKRLFHRIVLVWIDYNTRGSLCLRDLNYMLSNWFSTVCSDFNLDESTIDFEDFIIDVLTGNKGYVKGYNLPYFEPVYKYDCILTGDMPDISFVYNINEEKFEYRNMLSKFIGFRYSSQKVLEKD